ncbi:MAG TPA: SGNH/GDSL hydrolase family protein [Ktedonobacteraceae bacterium]|nr:SGNH/GDSL hydrolase family protein [Ktedonobacteraceae bacterium]
MLLFVFVFVAIWAIQPVSAQAASVSLEKETLKQVHRNFGKAYFFGDSLTDCCWLQRFTNGGTPNWADLLPPQIGADFTASRQTNLAVASAQSAYGSTSPTIPTLLGVQVGFLAQVDRFHSEGIKAGPHDIAGIWIGSNDIWPSSYAATDQPPDIVGPFNRSFGVQPDVAALTNYVMANLRLGVDRLVADGFKNIVLLSPYDIGQSAIEPNAAAAALATRYSIAIRNAEAHLYTPGVKTYFVDVLSLLQQVQAHPEAYGFTHTTAVDNCQANQCENLPLGQQNTYIFNDILHLTNGFHQVLAKYAAAVILTGRTIRPYMLMQSS